MIKGRMRFSSNQQLDREYAEFMDKFIEFSGEGSVMERKDSNESWKEFEFFSERAYVIETTFSEEEVEFLSREYPYRFKKMTDATVQNIGKVWVRYEREEDKKLEVKVVIHGHYVTEVNLKIDQQNLIYAGAMKRKGSLKKAETWINENKGYVLEEIFEQFPSFWEHLS